jgi:hypothetical protein
MVLKYSSVGIANAAVALTTHPQKRFVASIDRREIVVKKSRILIRLFISL